MSLVISDVQKWPRIPRVYSHAMRSTKLVRQLLTKYDLYSVPYISIHIQYVNKIGTEKHFILLLIMISMEVINNMTLHEKQIIYILIMLITVYIVLTLGSLLDNLLHRSENIQSLSGRIFDHSSSCGLHWEKSAFRHFLGQFLKF